MNHIFSKRGLWISGFLIKEYIYYFICLKESLVVLIYATNPFYRVPWNKMFSIYDSPWRFAKGICQTIILTRGSKGVGDEFPNWYIFFRSQTLEILSERWLRFIKPIETFIDSLGVARHFLPYERENKRFTEEWSKQNLRMTQILVLSPRQPLRKDHKGCLCKEIT